MSFDQAAQLLEILEEIQEAVLLVAGAGVVIAAVLLVRGRK